MGTNELYYFQYILARFEEFEYSHLLVDYDLVRNIYNNAKIKILGKFTSKARKRKLSPELKQLQNKFQSALTNVYLYEDNSLVEYAKLCERNLYMLNSKEESEEYSTWLSKLETLDHQKRSRVFFQNLKWKNKDYEFHGPIRNFKGKLSNSLSECLQFWSNYCQQLYSETGKQSFHYVPILDEKLDSPITYKKFKKSIMSLKNKKAPGSDFWTNEDFKKWFTSGDPEILGDALVSEIIYKVIVNFGSQKRFPQS